MVNVVGQNFKLWNKYLNCWSNPAILKISNSGQMYYQRDGRFIVSNYIGLDDNDKNPIYVGDILYCDDSAIGGYKGLGEVSYENDIALCPVPGFYIWCWEDGFNKGIDNRQFPYNKRIIGNIFEHRYLLDGHTNTQLAINIIEDIKQFRAKLTGDENDTR